MLLIFVVLAIAISNVIGEDPIVKTSTGTFRGHAVGIPDSNDKVYEFLSIPL